KLGANLEENGRRVHLSVVRPPNEGQSLREREEARRGLVSKAARAEVAADPDATLLVLHHVDVVVARADRAELRRRQLVQLALGREVRVSDLVEDRVIATLLRRDSHTERDPVGDLAHDALDTAERVNISARQLRSRRLVADADAATDAT